ncbi:MAG: response regulator [Lachnospiraceae bacterium]|nr:response regulator [Lachnospiraceae bacterium]
MERDTEDMNVPFDFVEDKSVTPDLQGSGLGMSICKQLVEDHPINAKITKKLLEKKRINVTHAENGKIAVERFSASADGHHEAILMDIRMPVMDGFSNIPMLANTQYDEGDQAEKLLEAGADDFVYKRTSPTIVMRRLKNILDTHRHR